MIGQTATADATAIAMRYEVSLKKARGPSKGWRAEQARCEIAWAMKTRHKVKQPEIAEFLGLTTGAVTILQKRYDLMVSGFQKIADRQHQDFLQTDEAAHIREELEKAKAENAELKRQAAWQEGRRGDGVRRADGFTEAETAILRIMASRESGRIAHEQHDALWRHMSNIRKKLPQGVTIKTLIGEGYELLPEGRSIIQALLMGARRDEAPRQIAKPATEPLQIAAH